MMREQGYLETGQMAGAFQILRSNGLIWSRIVHDYLMGERSPMTDLIAWNADARGFLVADLASLVGRTIGRQGQAARHG